MKPIVVWLLTILVVAACEAKEAKVEPLAYMTLADDDYNMFVIDQNTGEVLFSATSPEYECFVRASPDSNYLHYVTGDAQSEDAGFILNAITGEVVDVPHLRLLSVWSPDSRQLAFYSAQTLYVYNLERAQLTELITSPDLRLMQWSDDNLYFMFSDNNLVQINRWDGSTTVTSDALMPIPGPYTLSLSPDAQWLVIRTLVGDPSEAQWRYDLFNIATGDNKVLSYSANHHYFFWNPDNAYFTYVNDGHELVRYDLATESIKILANLEEFLSSVMLSPDGNHLSYNINSPESIRSYVLHVQSTQLTEILPQRKMGWNQLRWVSDTEVIYTYADVEHDDKADLYIFDITTQEVIQMTATPDLDERLECSWG